RSAVVVKGVEAEVDGRDVDVAVRGGVNAELEVVRPVEEVALVIGGAGGKGPHLRRVQEGERRRARQCGQDVVLAAEVGRLHYGLIGEGEEEVVVSETRINHQMSRGR